MNRQQRRAAGIKGRGATYTLNEDQIAEMKADACRCAEEAWKNQMKKEAMRSFTAVLGLPCMVLRDEFGFGPKRLERLIDGVMKEFAAIQTEHIEMHDLIDTIREETGIDLEEVERWGI